MAEVAGPSMQIAPENSPEPIEASDLGEPEAKKPKTDSDSSQKEYRLEERLNGILCCAVCLDLPTVAVYQCTNGHLMCASCFSHLLADARLKDENSTCPNCRCEISKTSCSRNLAVEKAISELPTECQYCSQQLPRCAINRHERDLCQERCFVSRADTTQTQEDMLHTKKLVTCLYERIGCPWHGPFHELQGHEATCAHPKKTGEEVMEALKVVDERTSSEMKLYKTIFNLLSFEKIAFNDLQLRPYRTDDYITKLFYETARFSAFNCQWVVKAQVNDNQKNPSLASNRSISYQMTLKSKSTSPINLHFVVLRPPYTDMSLRPAIHQFEFTTENNECGYNELPIDSNECNKMLSTKSITLRLIMFLEPK